jgi:thymidylate synthase (FAD)
MELLETRENIFGDNIANLKHYDFSRANLSDENRILAITTVKVYVNNKYDILL